MNKFVLIALLLLTACDSPPPKICVKDVTVNYMLKKDEVYKNIIRVGNGFQTYKLAGLNGELTLINKALVSKVLEGECRYIEYSN